MKATDENSTKHLEQMDQQEFLDIWNRMPHETPDFDESVYVDEEKGIAYRARFRDPRTPEVPA